MYENLPVPNYNATLSASFILTYEIGVHLKGQACAPKRLAHINPIKYVLTIGPACLCLEQYGGDQVSKAYQTNCTQSKTSEDEAGSRCSIYN